MAATTGTRSVAVVGVGQTDWRGDWQRTKAGEKPTDSAGYGALAFRNALADAGMSRDDVDGLIVGPPLVYERTAELFGMDVRWGGQADAVNAVFQACFAIESGLADVVALVYGNNQRSGGTQYGGGDAAGASFLSYFYHAPWGLTSQGALYAMTFNAYRHARGFTEADLGQVAVAQRSWARLNPGAIMQEGLTLEQYLASRYVCEPLRYPDYCLVNDGGVALILAESSRARSMGGKPVYIEALGRSDLNCGASTLEPRLTDFYAPAQRKVADQVFGRAGIGPGDVDLALVYDSFSVHVPLALEGYGYCATGDAARFMREEGIGPGGALPVNSHGGHLSESYMQGWSHQLEAVRQLRGICGPRQIESCRHVHYSSAVGGKAMSIIYGK